MSGYGGNTQIYELIYISAPVTVPLIQVGPLGAFYTYFYNHARRLRLEKLLYRELSRSPSGYFKPLLDPGDGFRSETAVTKPFRK
jgi:hypothetical protein